MAARTSTTGQLRAADYTPRAAAAGTQQSRRAFAPCLMGQTLDGAEAGYFVGVVPTGDNLPLMGRLFVKLLLKPLQRFAYRRWAHGIMDSCAICTTKTRARAMAAVNGGFFQELPVDVSLPEATVQYGTHEFPATAGTEYVKNRRLAFVPVSRQSLRVHRELAAEARALLAQIVTRAKAT